MCQTIFQNETRRFRVKFNGSDDVTGKQFCDDCLEKLANYFPIKTSSIDPQAAGNSNTAVATTELVKVGWLQGADTTIPFNQVLLNS